MRISARLQRGDLEGPFAEFRRFAEQRMENAALIAIKRAGGTAKSRIHQEGPAAGLGRLLNAVDVRADDRVHRYPNGGFSVSAAVFVRSRSERTLGAIRSYTEGASIQPRRGRFLWIPTPEIQRRAGPKGGRVRVEPGNWTKLGLDQRIGPLVLIKSASGTPLLVVRNVGVSAAGRAGSARSLTKRGTPRKGQIEQPLVVAFIAIPRTSRAARVDVPAILQSVAGQLPDLFNQALGRF